MTRQSPRALIVDDDANVCFMLGRMFEAMGWEVIQANTVADAIERLIVVFELVILDLMLPDGDGVAVLKTIRDRKITVPVIVATGKHVDKVGHKDMLDVVRELNPDQLLEKPMSYDVIKAMAEDIRERFTIAGQP